MLKDRYRELHSHESKNNIINIFRHTCDIRKVNLTLQQTKIAYSTLN